MTPDDLADAHRHLEEHASPETLPWARLLFRRLLSLLQDADDAKRITETGILAIAKTIPGLLAKADEVPPEDRTAWLLGALAEAHPRLGDLKGHLIPPGMAPPLSPLSPLIPE